MEFKKIEGLNRERLFDVDDSDFVINPATEDLIAGKEATANWKCEELFNEFGEDKIYMVQGAYVFATPRSLYNTEAATLALEDRYLNVPNFQLEDIKKILADTQEGENYRKIINADRMAVQIVPVRNRRRNYFKIEFLISDGK